jgi:hypothetical protein
MNQEIKLDFIAVHLTVEIHDAALGTAKSHAA